MRNESNITAEQVRAMLDYNPDTGEFRWKFRAPETFHVGTPTYRIFIWNKRFAGKIAGATSKGRVHISINGKLYFAHRLAMLIALGRWPKHEVDHINGDPVDNRLCNLREATSGQNQQNTKKRVTNTSGYTGVNWCKQQKKWVSKISLNGKSHHLGRHDTKEDAYAAYLKAKSELHPFQPIPRGDRDEQAA